MTAPILQGIVDPTATIGNLTYGDLERIIKFVSQNNPVRWYDGKRYWKNSAFSLFNKYPAFNVNAEMGDAKTYTLFPRLCRGKPKVYLLETDTPDPAKISACINYANTNCLVEADRTVEALGCRFREPPQNLVNLTSFLEQASQGVTSMVPPQHVIDTMARMPKGGSNFKTKFKRTKARRRTAHDRNNKVQQRNLDRMDQPVPY